MTLIQQTPPPEHIAGLEQGWWAMFEQLAATLAAI
jgi:hypothetical protein